VKLGGIWRWLRKAIAKVAKISGTADVVLPPVEDDKKK
jgi:hypothetical protein